MKMMAKLSNARNFIIIAMFTLFSNTSLVYAEDQRSAPPPGGVYVNKSNSFPIEKWAYKVIKIHKYELMQSDTAEKQLNNLGNDGWELVAVERLIYNGTNTYFVYTFKKLKSST